MRNTLLFICYTIIMTIADLIKYIDSLKKRSDVLADKIRKLENVKTSTRIVAQTGNGAAIEEVSTPLIDAESLMAEYDTNSKELRLAQQALEKANHTTEVVFSAKY